VMAAHAAAWARGDVDAVWAFYADDVVMTVPGRGTLAGLHEGRPSVMAAVEALLARTSDLSVDVEVLDHLASDDRVAVVIRQSVRRGDRTLEIRRVNLYRVKAGLIVAIDVFEGDQYEIDEFFR